MDKEHQSSFLEIIDQGETKRIALKSCDVDSQGITIDAEVDENDESSRYVNGGMEGRLNVGKESFPVTVEEILNFPALRLTKRPTRKNVRVDTSLPMTIKRISPQELYDYLKNGLSILPSFGSSFVDKLFSEGQGEFIHTHKEIEAISPVLQRVLSDLNSKLDLLFFLVGNDEYKALLVSPPKKINLSGSGLAFYSDQVYGVGEAMVLKMALPLSPLAFIELIVEVVSCSETNRQKEEGNIYRVAAKYVLISDESREKIIRYVFQRQREVLREKN
jgi:hypothetical protein